MDVVTTVASSALSMGTCSAAKAMELWVTSTELCSATVITAPISTSTVAVSTGAVGSDENHASK